ncbi:MAG: hypothetical protein ACRDD7_11015 [Peptostreptococcaceae bacterium]
MKNTKSSFNIVCSVLIGLLCTSIALFFVYKLTPDNKQNEVKNKTEKVIQKD